MAKNRSGSTKKTNKRKQKNSKGSRKNKSGPVGNLSVQRGPSGDGNGKSKAVSDLKQLEELLLSDENEEVACETDVIVEIPTEVDDGVRWTEVNRRRSEVHIPAPSNDESNGGKICNPSGKTLKISVEDIAPEVEYWSSAVLCYVLGARPPWEVFNGFIRRIWGKFGLHSVILNDNGVFVVRFNDMAGKVGVLGSGVHLFGSKPVILRPWTVDTKLDKVEVKRVPILIRLHLLDLKYWGQVMQIAGLLGEPIKMDEATENRL